MSDSNLGDSKTSVYQIGGSIRRLWLSENQKEEHEMSDGPTVIEDRGGYIYGIYWQRDEPLRWVPDPRDVDWYPSYSEARKDYDSRDDKYWPSLFVQGFATIWAVEEGQDPYE